MKVVLKDGAPRNLGHVNVNVSKTGNTLEVGIEGTVAPVVLEYYDGLLKLRVYDGQTLLFFKELSAIPAPIVEPPPTLAVAASQANAIVAAEIVMAAPKPVPDTVETSDDDELAAFDAA